MPTLEQIEKIHDELGNARSLSSYLQALRGIGVVSYESFIHDGHSEYLCDDGQTLASESTHEELAISEAVDTGRFLEVLDQSAEEEIGYLDMSKGLAESGVDRWKFDTQEMTMAYLDKAGETLLNEHIG